MDPNKINITLDGGYETTCFAGTLVKNIIKKIKKIDRDEDLPYLGALVNNETTSLTYPLDVDSKISLLTLENSDGWRIYRLSLSFLLSKAVDECFSDLGLEIKHSLGEGLFCSFKITPSYMSLEEVLKCLEIYMQELVAAKIPIIRRKLYFEDALFHFASKGKNDKANLLHFQNPPKVVVYQCENFMDLDYGVLVDNTRVLGHFKLIPYETGFVLQFPEKKYPIQFRKFKKQPHLFNIFKSYKEWGRTIGIQNIGDLNEIIVRGNFREHVEVEEAYHENKIAEITASIAEKKDIIKWILIAGPSSSGKTTFAHRLATQVKVHGINPKILSVDNYFKNREDTPRDPEGNYDFEHIEALDLNLLHEHILMLDNGCSVKIPNFNFKMGKREYVEGQTMQLKNNDMVIVEGIHGLNPRLTESLPDSHKFRIYINALTQLNIDDNNRISTTDNRLLRRIVRDHRTRGSRALATLQMWPNVRHGEMQWIFPYQHLSDCTFSSALNYELAVLKPVVEPLLAEVKSWHPQYSESRRLQKFLQNFSPAPSTFIPHRSILREFIGNGIIEEKK